MFTKELTYKGNNGADGQHGENGISGSSGRSGASGENGKTGPKNGASGKNGKKGGKGSSAQSSGGNGENGASGQNGLDTESRISLEGDQVYLSNNTIKTIEINPEDTILIDTSGGNGGSGGAGGNGGNGGAGGSGGRGGSGGNAKSQIFSGKDRKNNGGNGGNGGDGGDGGDGGNGKHGGDGGNGGDAGNAGKNTIIANDPRLLSLIELRAGAGNPGNYGSAGSGGNSRKGSGGSSGSGGSRTYGIHGGRNGSAGNSGHSGRDGNSGNSGHPGHSGRNGRIGKDGFIEYIIKDKEGNNTFNNSYAINYDISIIEDGNFSDGVLAPGEKIILKATVENTGEMNFPSGAVLTITSDKLTPNNFKIDLPEIIESSPYESNLDAQVSTSSVNGDKLKIESSIDFPGICKNYRANKLTQTITLPITASCAGNFPKHLYPNKKTFISLKVANNSKIPYKGIKIISKIETGNITFIDFDKEYSIDIESIESGASQDFKIPLLTDKLITDQNIKINTEVFALESPVFKMINTSTVTPKKKYVILLMAILGSFIGIPLQRFLTYHIQIGLGVTTTLFFILLLSENIIGDEAALPFMGGAAVLFLGFQIYDFVNIVINKYKDKYGNLLHQNTK